MKHFIIILFIAAMAVPAASAEETAAPARIISLAPSTTEILFALGLGDRIVGVTTFCDHPEAAKKKPKIGGMSNPSLEAVVSLQPDLVVLSTDGNPKEIRDRLQGLHIRTFVFTARRIGELPGGIRELGRAVGSGRAADRLAERVERSLTADAERLRLHAKHLKGLFILWPKPLIVAGPGTAIDDAMRLIGVENEASGAKTAYPRYSLEEVIRQAPDVLFIGKASGMDIRSVSGDLLEKLKMVPAVRRGAVCYVGDGLYRLGPRVVQGMEELAACVR